MNWKNHEGQDYYSLSKTLHRIIKGSFTRDGITVRSPNIAELTEANQYYHEEVEKLSNNGVPLFYEVTTWNQQEEDKLELFRKHIERTKVDYYEEKRKSGNTQRVFNHYQECIQKIQELSKRKSYNYSSSADGIAEYYCQLKLAEMISDSDNLEKSIGIYNSQAITEQEYRRLCRSEPWAAMYFANKVNNSMIFNACGVFLTEEQTQLLSWSKVYDNVREHPERPADFIIEDNLALDGWMIVESENSKKRSQENVEVFKNPKIKGHTEGFVVVKSQEQANNAVYSQDTPMQKHLRNNMKGNS